jgi:hypothetical protein
MMAESTLVQVRHLVDELSPLEQVRLLEYLTPRIVHAISSQQAVFEGLACFPHFKNQIESWVEKSAPLW